MIFFYKWALGIGGLYSRRSVLYLIVAICLLALTGCQKHDETSVGWTPTPFVFGITMSEDGVVKASAGIPLNTAVNTIGAITHTNVCLPIENLGSIGISQTFNFSQECTYIIIRNTDKHCDQIFKVGITGKVVLVTSGEHELTLYNEGENRFIVEDKSTSPMTIKFIPKGKEIAEVNLGSDAKFLFLVNHYLRVEYPSLSHPYLHPLSLLSPSNWFHKDDLVCLDSIKSVAFHRDYQVCQMIFNWKDDISANQKPMAIDLPLQLGGSNADKILEFKSALSSEDAEVAFNTNFSETGFRHARRILAYALSIFVILFVVILSLTRRWVTGILLSLWTFALLITLLQIKLNCYSYDVDYWNTIVQNRQGIDCKCIQLLFN